MMNAEVEAEDGGKSGKLDLDADASQLPALAFSSHCPRWNEGANHQLLSGVWSVQFLTLMDQDLSIALVLCPSG